MPGPETISPTAHYTAAVWGAHGLSHPAFVTTEGRALHLALRPTMFALAAAGQPRLEDFLLARHAIIDTLLEEAIAAGRVGQVVEIAAGMSPRGWRFAQRHGDALAYVEADLPGMAARKREALARAGVAEGGAHRVVELDALSDDGLAALAATLDPGRGLAVVTEGLLNYFDRDAVLGLWRRIAATLRGFPDGLYLSDLHLESEAGGRLGRAFAVGLGVFVRGQVHLHFADAAEAERELHAAGFARAVLHRPAAFGFERTGAQLVRVVDAGP